QAQEVVTQARSVYYPQVDLATSANRIHAWPPGPVTQNSNGVANALSFGPLLTYSPDLFGHNRRFVEQQSALAAPQAYHPAPPYLAPTTGTVSQAVTTAATLAQIKAAEAIIASDERNLELVRIAFTAGIVARTDVLSAQSQLASDQTLLPP